MKIVLENVCKSFNHNLVLDKINVTFESGKIYGLNGRNGSGKSVLLKLLCGIYNVSDGSILYDGKPIKEAIIANKVRALIEKPSFFPDLTGFENLQLLAKIQNIISDEDILKAMEIVNLSSEKDKKFSKYSLGMKQKLGIAQVIMENPDVLFLDEPFNGVDTVSIKKIIDFLKVLKKEGKLIIISSHISEDLKLADEIYNFDNFKIKKV
ncbi:aBC-type multidrug transport system ATPase component [Mycoplasma sp. CAG:472]|nr:aBC-type multidrug transport system ATPase component [Mycoplasma sp. CAG:472]